MVVLSVFFSVLFFVLFFVLFSGLELKDFDVEQSFVNAHNPQMALSLYSHVRHLELVRINVLLIYIYI